MGRIVIRPFKTFKGKTRYDVKEDNRKKIGKSVVGGQKFLSGGHASKKSAEIERRRYIKNRKKYGSIYGKR